MIALEFEVTIPPPESAEDLTAVIKKVSAACAGNNNTRLKIKWVEPQNIRKVHLSSSKKESFDEFAKKLELLFKNGAANAQGFVSPK